MRVQVWLLLALATAMLPGLAIGAEKCFWRPAQGCRPVPCSGTPLSTWYQCIINQATVYGCSNDPKNCKEIKVSKPLPATASSAGSPASICGTTNSTMSTISGADWRLLSTCLNKPTPQCYIRAQEILLQTGCVDCLPYLQEHDTRANAYCSERASKRDCEAASAPCQKESLIQGDVSKLPNPEQLDSLSPVPYLVVRDRYWIEQKTASSKLAVTLLTGAAAQTAVECAQACTNFPGCNLATWHGADPLWSYNYTCWLKAWSDTELTCADVVGANYRAASYILVRKTPECAQALQQQGAGFPGFAVSAKTVSPRETEQLLLPTDGCPAVEGKDAAVVAAGTVAGLAALLAAAAFGLLWWQRRRRRGVASVGSPSGRGFGEERYQSMVAPAMHKQASATPSYDPSELGAAAREHSDAVPPVLLSTFARQPSTLTTIGDTATLHHSETSLASLHGNASLVPQRHSLPSHVHTPPTLTRDASAPISHGQIGSDLLRITSDTRSGTLTSDVTLPVAEAFTSTEARQAGRYSMQALEDTLDYMHEHREPFLEGYVMSSAFERFEGGQGLVQFCHQEHRKEEAVIKFYTNVPAFERERELYEATELKHMMPATKAIVDNRNGQVKASTGYVFPPCIIIERGESLDQWAKREAQRDFVTTLQVLHHIATRLQMLHAAGWAHLDLKPGNVLRRPQMHAWTLLDFGCTARTGKLCGISYSLCYAAPEVLMALEQGQKQMVADPAVDIWALGVIAYELLTGKALFPRGSNKGTICAQLAGRQPLPWEDPARQAELDHMKGLKRSVLRCLSRNPSQRPTSDLLIRRWEHMFESINGTATMWEPSSSNSGCFVESTSAGEPSMLLPPAPAALPSAANGSGLVALSQPANGSTHEASESAANTQPGGEGLSWVASLPTQTTRQGSAPRAVVESDVPPRADEPAAAALDQAEGAAQSAPQPTADAAACESLTPQEVRPQEGVRPQEARSLEQPAEGRPDAPLGA